MKIIELLNKIANRETTYDYIEYWNRNKDKYDVMLVCEENLIYKLNNGDILLTDEVNRAKGYEEEPQEHKIPEKLNLSVINADRYNLKKDISISNIAADFLSIGKTINEIIDYLEEIK